MRKYFLGFPMQVGTDVTLQGEIFHHIIEVCRNDLGKKIELMDGQGRAFTGEVTKVGKKSACVTLIEERDLPQINPPYIHLALCLPKFSTFESVLEKSVELGVKSIQPLFNDYSFVKNRTKISQSRIERWERVVRGAIQQSGAGYTMGIEPPKDLGEFLTSINQSPGSKCLFPYEGDPSVLLKEFLEGDKSLKELDSLTDIWIFIGSEGGFSVREVDRFNELGVKPVSLGDQVLRVETACVSLVSILKYHCGL